MVFPNILLMYPSFVQMLIRSTNQVNYLGFEIPLICVRLKITLPLR
jgi:hypothetical protein